MPTPDFNQLKKTEQEFKDVMLASVKHFHQACLDSEKAGNKPAFTSNQVLSVLVALQLFQKVELGDTFKSSLERKPNES